MKSKNLLKLKELYDSFLFNTYEEFLETNLEILKNEFEKYFLLSKHEVDGICFRTGSIDWTKQDLDIHLFPFSDEEYIEDKLDNERTLIQVCFFPRNMRIDLNENEKIKFNQMLTQFGYQFDREKNKIYRIRSIKNFFIIDEVYAINALMCHLHIFYNKAEF